MNPTFKRSVQTCQQSCLNESDSESWIYAISYAVFIQWVSWISVATRSCRHFKLREIVVSESRFLRIIRVMKLMETNDPYFLEITLPCPWHVTSDKYKALEDERLRRLHEISKEGSQYRKSRAKELSKQTNRRRRRVYPQAYFHIQCVKSIKSIIDKNRYQLISINWLVLKIDDQSMTDFLVSMVDWLSVFFTNFIDKSMTINTIKEQFHVIINSSSIGRC